MDGQRTYPEDQEPRWRQETYGDEPYRVPEPRGAETPSFNGFTERPDKPGDTGEHRWGQPPYDAPPPPPQPQYDEAPSWRTQEPTLLPTARPTSGPPQPGGPDPFDAPPRDEPRYHAQPIDRAALRREPASNDQTGQMPPIAPDGGFPPAPAPGQPDPGFGAGPGPGFAPPPHMPPAQLLSPVSSQPQQAGDGVYRTRRPAAALIVAIVTGLFLLGALRVLVDGLFGGPFLPGPTVAGMLLVAGLPVFALGLYGAAGGGVRSEPGNWTKPPVLYLVAGLGLLIAATLAL